MAPQHSGDGKSETALRIATPGPNFRFDFCEDRFDRALRSGTSQFELQAAIAALHCQPARAEDTDWPQIVRLYDRLEQIHPSPIVSLNRTVAVAMLNGPERGSRALRALTAAGDLGGYHLLYAARADLLRRLGSYENAAKCHERALSLATNDSERRYLERRLREVRPREAV